MTETVDETTGEEWNHYLSEDEWNRVVERATTIAAERQIERESTTLSPLARAFTPTNYDARYVDFPNSPNKKSSTRRTKQLWVIHTAECPLADGYETSLTEWADGDSYNPRVSWHRFVGPYKIARFIPLGEAAWHASVANRISTGYEQSGYASYTRTKWMSALGLRQISLLAEELVKNGIPAKAVRKLSNSEVASALNGNTSVEGLCSHAAINPASRTDPGAGYPWDILIDYIRWFHPDFDVAEPTPDPVPSGSPYLTEDGINDLGTRKAIQRLVGTTADGDWGTETWKAIQRRAGLTGAEIDGYPGPITDDAVARWIGMPELVGSRWSWGWTDKPTAHTRGLEAYYNRAVERGWTPPA